jgi:hypothetical protein
MLEEKRIGFHYPGSDQHPGEVNAQPAGLRAKEKDLGDDLLSQTVASPVPSALTGLTAVFGMGTGVSPSLWSPKSFSSIAVRRSALGTARITHDRPPALIRYANQFAWSECAEE